jgi:hypothetical protein
VRRTTSARGHSWRFSARPGRPPKDPSKIFLFLTDLLVNLPVVKRERRVCIGAPSEESSLQLPHFRF